MELVDIIWKALPGLTQAAILAACGVCINIARKWHSEHVDIKEFKANVEEFIATLKEQHEALMESQRNQIKNTIVHSHATSTERGYITPWELDCIDRLSDSYFKLGGNSYIHTTMDKINMLPVEDDREESRKRKRRRLRR